MDRKQKLTGIVALLILINLAVLHEWRLRKEQAQSAPTPPPRILIDKTPIIAQVIPAAPVIPEKSDLPEWHPYQESVCEPEVRMTARRLNPGEQPAGEVLWLLLRPSAPGRLRILQTDSDDLYLEVENPPAGLWQRQPNGWVKKGQVADSCPVDEANDIQ